MTTLIIALINWLRVYTTYTLYGYGFTNFHGFRGYLPITKIDSGIHKKTYIFTSPMLIHDIVKITVPGEQLLQLLRNTYSGHKVYSNSVLCRIKERKEKYPREYH